LEEEPWLWGHEISNLLMVMIPEKISHNRNEHNYQKESYCKIFITKRKVIAKFSNVGKQQRIEIVPYLSAL
jgi:hypothetical protein